MTDVPADSINRSDWSKRRGRWQVREHLIAGHGDDEWIWIESKTHASARLRAAGNFVLSVAVSGTAAAAGLSFGDYKDFLVPLNSAHGVRLQLEVDANTRTWTFRVDGKLMGRQWWDSAIHSVEDIFAGTLALKVHKAQEVVFRDLALHSFESSCRLSVIITCYRFAERLRVALRNWCLQSLPSGALEVIVANPQSPDRTHDVVAAMCRAFPLARVRELAAETRLARNKGAMINRAVDASRGDWIWLTDADCLWPPNAAESVLARVQSTHALHYAERRHLTADITNELLTGRRDAVTEFNQIVSITRPDSNTTPWGYCQIVHRSVFGKVRYREDVNSFSSSDISFVEQCVRHGVVPVRLPDLLCLHLDHPWAWTGTNLFL
jgi:hypothetical protein